MRGYTIVPLKEGESVRKACSVCGRIHPEGFSCHHKRTYTGGDERKLRSTYAWTQKAQEMKEEAQYLCEVCRAEGVYTYSRLETHHIDKLRLKHEGLLQDENLICLCERHHREADRGIISAERLRQIARERGEN